MQQSFSKRNAHPVPKSRLISGRRPVIEALSYGKSVEKIFILKSATGEEIDEIRTAARKQNIPVSFVPMEKLTRLTRTNHQGVVAIAGLIEYQQLQDIIDQLVGDGLTPLFVVADGITDTRNLGAIARSAVCFGAHALIVPASNSAAITDESVKASAGALEQLAICRTTSIQESVDILKLNGIALVATAMNGPITISEPDLSIPTAIIMGSEGKGISTYVEKRADSLVKIPMSSNLDSLNVSVAAGIMLYEAFKQRN